MTMRQYLKRGSMALVLAALVALLPATVSAQYTLTILHNNDGESQLVNAGSGLEDFGGIARFKTLVGMMRTAATTAGNAVVTLSSGDNFLAGPEFNLGVSLPVGTPMYDAVALDAINYDAICLGNHDFDFGPDVLARLIGDFPTNNTPYLSCNLDFSGETALNALVGTGRIAARTVVIKNGEKIGIVGATTPQLPFISSPRNVLVDNDVKAAVQAEVDALMGEGVNKIILISHLQSIEEDRALASELKNIDVMIAGGGDELLANGNSLLLPGDTAEVYDTYPIIEKDADGKDVIIVTTSGDYRYVGHLTVTFDGSGEITAVDPLSGPVRVAGGTNPDAVIADQALQANVVDPIVAGLAEMAGNIIVHTEPPLDGRRNSVRGMETNLGNLIGDALLWQGQQLAAQFNVDAPTVALQNGGGIRNNNVIATGPVSELNTYEILPFANYLAVVPNISAAQFKEILENAVSLVESGSGRFAQIGGFSFRYDVTKTAMEFDQDGNVSVQGERVLEVTLSDGTKLVENGTVVPGAPAVSVATADFLARGGDQYPFNGAAFTSLGVSYQQALFNYLETVVGDTVSALDYPRTGSARIIEESTQFPLTVLHNNDGESQLVNAGSGLEDFGGVARFKAVVDREKMDASSMGHAVVTLSSGDNFLAGPEFNLGLNRAGNEPMYDAMALDAIGYDAICIGNHDFDFGPDVLARLIGDFSTTQPPYLSANLDFSNEPALDALVGSGRIAPRTVIEVNGDRIGVVGATTPALPYISSPRNVAVDADVVAVVQAQIDALENDGVNKIILISHLQSANEDIELAGQLRGVDVMIAGGGDEVLANDGDLLMPGDTAEVFGPYPIVVLNADNDPVYIVTTAGEYRNLGKLGVEFNAAGEVNYVHAASGLIRIAGGSQPDAVTPDAALQQNIVDPIVAGLSQMASNVIGTSDVGLDGRRGEVRTRETNLGNLIADALLWQGQQLASQFGVPAPQVAIQNGGGIRNNNIIEAGNLTELTTFDVLPFANFACIVPDIPATQVKEILENAVSQVENTSGRFLQIAGMEFIYDPEGTPQELDEDGNVTVTGTRVQSAMLDNGTKIVENGSVVPGAPNVHMATIDFIARGGDQTPFRGADFTTVGVSYQQALQNYIVSGLGGTVSASDYAEGGEGRITTTTTSVEDINGIPQAMTLGQNYPNPATGYTAMQFALAKRSAITLRVYDVFGREIATLARGIKEAGVHSAGFNVSALPAGMYYYRLESGTATVTRQLVVVK